MIEILHKDLLGRITRFKTKTGLIETPAFLPVIHPTRVLIPPQQILKAFDCSAIITNAYLLLNAEKEGCIHKLLNFPGSIMTDSGAYQLLVYGQVDVTPTQIVQFQEAIGSDIAVILDTPTGGNATYKQAKATVEETLKRAKESISQRTRSDILWVAPIQGGTYPELVTEASQRISQLDFSIYAIGSPTQLMEQYQFGKLVNLIMAAKRSLPTNKPVHLFGAGHPMIFPLITAMGCDMFDSAAYAIFARHDRLLTPNGTYRLKELHEQFCFCPACQQYSISELKQLDRPERTQVLAKHNLYTCVNEINRIKQAIREGRLWQLVESRLSSHPSLVDAMNRLRAHASFIEQFSPITKKRALFISSKWSLFQPEIVRHQKRIISYSPPSPNCNTLLIIATLSSRPYDSASEYEKVRRLLREYTPRLSANLDVMFISPYLGLIPLELSNVYPLAQNETPRLKLSNWSQLVFEQLSCFLSKSKHYSVLIGIFPQDTDWRNFSRLCTRLLKKLLKLCLCMHTNFQSKSLRRIMSRITKELQTQSQSANR